MASDACMGIMPSMAILASLSERWNGASYHQSSVTTAEVGEESTLAAWVTEGVTLRAVMLDGSGMLMASPFWAAMLS